MTLTLKLLRHATCSGPITRDTSTKAGQPYGWNSPQADAISSGSSGLHAFAKVPRAHVRSGLRAFDRVPRAAFGSESASATGGGSIGYNSYIGRDS